MLDKKMIGLYDSFHDIYINEICKKLISTSKVLEGIVSF